ncbi:hypothetical protein [Zooshikella harenae]|uniref:DUF2489 domain-containing protein n=1 Tax=Zooshikella harenae TaxID=2827238 RepID=A0ABS5ZGP2_9GAMM|nr:hypothetical protein [Zooshikella harenae]MBU2713228.1 hypothetical protein [Zooshikella harenae]
MSYLFLITLLICVLILGSLFYLLARLRTPYYRISQQQVVTILQRAINQQLEISEWHIFISLPIRHNAALEHARQICQQLDDNQQVKPSSEHMLQCSEEAIDTLNHLIHELKRQGELQC